MKISPCHHVDLLIFLTMLNKKKSKSFVYFRSKFWVLIQQKNIKNNEEIKRTQNKPGLHETSNITKHIFKCTRFNWTYMTYSIFSTNIISNKVYPTDVRFNLKQNVIMKQWSSLKLITFSYKHIHYHPINPAIINEKTWHKKDTFLMQLKNTI